MHPTLLNRPLSLNSALQDRMAFEEHDVRLDLVYRYSGIDLSFLKSSTASPQAVSLPQLGWEALSTST